MKDNSQYSQNKFIMTLNECLNVKNKTRAEIIKGAKIDRTYGYQIFKGIRKPSRDRIIMLCIALNLSVDESSKLLESAKFARLLKGEEREDIIINSLSKGKCLNEVNYKLRINNLRELY